MSTDTAAAAKKNPLSRVPAGITTGGQFAATAHAEPDVSLPGYTMDDFNDRAILDQAYASTQYWQKRYSQAGKSNTVDTDDIAQESLLRVLEMVAKGKSITDFRQLLSSVSANVTVRATETVFRAADRLAYRRFEEKCTAVSHRENRELTAREKDVLAQEVLDEWHDPRHKPSKEFRVARTVERSLDAPMGSRGENNTLGSTLVAGGETESIPVDSYMDRAFTAMETPGVANKAKARRLAWNALAERAGVPLSQEGSLSQRHATRYRSIMSGHDGGVMAACRDWSNGNDNDATEALFAPFGEDLDVHQQEQVVNMLEHLDDAEKADTLWASAIAFANNKHAETK